jgi:hypothetical protein
MVIKAKEVYKKNNKSKNHESRIKKMEGGWRKHQEAQPNPCYIYTFTL